MQPLEEHDPLRVGEYELLGRLGGGGMGRVYLGRSASGRKVAVKVISEALARDPLFRERFRHEVAAAGRVHAFFTASVLKADPDAAQPWMATAYIQGQSLQQRVTEGGPLTVAQVSEIAAGVAEALTEIHGARIVHRDLKPSNVMLSPDGPRVIDFGVARAAESTVLTAAGTLTGSGGFMSPEQAQGQDVTAATDVFSLGALLYWALVGESPFGTGALPAVMYRVVHQDVDLGPVSDPDLRDLIGACLLKDPPARPTAAQVLARATDLLGPGHPAPGPLPLASKAAAWNRPAARTGGDTAEPESSQTMLRAPATSASRPAWARRRLPIAAAVTVVILLAGSLGVLWHGGMGPFAPIAAHPLSTGQATPAGTGRATPTSTPSATHTPKPKATPTATKTRPAATKKPVPLRHPVAGALLMSDSFTGSSGGSWGSRWALGRDPNSGQGGGASLSSGMGRLTTSDLGAVGAARIARRASIAKITDVDVRFTFRFDSTACHPEVFVRANQSLDTKDGDYLRVGAGEYNIGRVTGYKDSINLPSVDDGATAATYQFVAGATYRAHFAARGHDLYASIWPTSQPEPSQWTLHIRDAGAITAGAVGFSLGPGSAKKPSNWYVDDVALRKILR